jgi:hypothetical protein
MAFRVARHGYATNLVLYARRYVPNFLLTTECRPPLNEVRGSLIGA